MRRAPIAILILLATIAIPAPRAHGDEDLDLLLRQFDVLKQSLEAVREVSDADRPATEAFADRVATYSDANPDEVRSVALELQVRIWLEDDERVGELYARLVELRPDDVDLAVWALDYTLGDAADDPDARISAMHAMLERYERNLAVAEALARLLAREVRYEEAVTVLESVDLDPATQPEAVLLLAECQFATNRFQAAAETVASIPAGAPYTDRTAPARAAQLATDATNGIAKWEAEQQLRSAEMERNDDPLVQIMTSKGRIVVELFEDSAPNTVKNFVALAEQGFYDGTRFHRWVENFMVQGGDPLSRPDAEGTPGMGGPGYVIPDEHELPTVRNHFADSVSMANRGTPNSGGSQFFFNHRATPHLDGKHTVFGRVIEGLDVAHALRQDDELISVTVIRTRDHAYEPATLPEA